VGDKNTSIHDGYVDVLSDQFAGSRLMSVQRLTGGVSADVYRLDLAFDDEEASPVVLRIHGDTHSGHDAELEFQLLKVLYKGDVPVPEPLLVDTSAERVPDPFLIMRFIDGSTHVPQEYLEQRIETMAETLAQIHTLPLVGLPELPIRNEPWPEFLDYLPDGEEWQQLGERLGELKLPRFDDTSALLHGDFWPENLLWRDGQIAAVLDWEDSAVGDRHADLAAARVELRYLFGREVMDQFSAAYARHLPLNHERLMLWQIYVAAAAQKYMHYWNLPDEREAHMREQALASVREAFDELLV
jgi:aminoglycoside phosphotransferase (APT) family kinase protein